MVLVWKDPVVYSTIRVERMIQTPQELEHLLSIGVVCYVHWKQEGLKFQTAPGRIRQVKDDKILIDHWESYWTSFYNPTFTIRKA